MRILIGLILAGFAAGCDAASVEPGGLAAKQRPVVATPAATGWVSDHAGLLSDAEHAQLESTLVRFERRTGNELAVLTVPSTGSESIEGFALRVAREWGVGKPGAGNGLLVVVARDDRRVRIEVADGLRSSVPDRLAQTIVDAHFVSAFKGGRYAEGLREGIEMLIGAMDGA